MRSSVAGYLQLKPPPLFGNYVAWLAQQGLAEAKQFWQKARQGSFSNAVGRGTTSRERRQSDWGARDSRIAALHGNIRRSPLRRSGKPLHDEYPGAGGMGATAESIQRGRGRRVWSDTGVCGSAFDGIQEIVGVVINTVPMRVAVPAGATWLPWLKGLRSQWIAMRPFERAPLADIIQWSGATPGTPLLSSLMICENGLLNTALKRKEKNSAAREFKSRSVTNYPLTVVAFAEPQWILKIGYERSRFDEATVRRMLEHLQNSLEHLAADLHKPLKSHTMLTRLEQRQLLCEWQRTERTFPGADCVHRLFEEQVVRSPDAVAVACHNSGLTYRELNERSNQLGHYLQRTGVGSGSLVGIFLERSPDVIVALMAIQKAGSAYLPLDAAYPRQRLDSMIKDDRLSVVVTVSALAPRVTDSGARMICLDSHAERIARERVTNPVSNASLESLAYAVFTSGSTGQPKGILIPHRALTNHTLALIEKYGISAADRRLQFVSMSSDVLIAEVFPYLLSGATVVLRPSLNASSIADFLQCLDEEKITVVGAPSVLWHEWVMFMAQNDVPFPRSLRVVIAGMDRVHPDLFAIWKGKVKQRARWFNAYGPAEATCTTTVYEADLSSDEVLASVPIGRPIANAKVYLLDTHLNPVPIGVPGEIYIGGCGLARGYLNNPQLTAQRFIPNPFLCDPQERIYKTGDLRDIETTETSSS